MSHVKKSMDNKPKTKFFFDMNEDNPQVRPEVINAEAVGQWIRDYTMTRKGERLFNLDYGVELDDYLFDLITDENAVLLFASLTSQLTSYLPMVKVLTNSSVILPDTENNLYAIELAYEIVGFDGNNYSTTVVVGR